MAVSGGAAANDGISWIEIVADDAEVVEGDVGEVGRAGGVAHGPDAGSGSFEAVVDLDVAGLGGLDAGEFEAHVLRVGRAAGRDQDVRALQGSVAGLEGEVQGDGVAGGAVDTLDAERW